MWLFIVLGIMSLYLLVMGAYEFGKHKGWNLGADSKEKYWSHCHETEVRKLRADLERQITNLKATVKRRDKKIEKLENKVQSWHVVKHKGKYAFKNTLTGQILAKGQVKG